MYDVRLSGRSSDDRPEKTICLPQRANRPQTADAQPTLLFRRGKRAVLILVYSRNVMPAGSHCYSTLIVDRLVFSIFGIVNSRMPFLKEALASFSLTAAGKEKVLWYEPRQISCR